MELNKQYLKNEAGISLVEILVAFVVVSLIGLSLTHSLISSLKTHKNSQVHNAATTLALNKIEIYSAINPQEMNSSSHDDSETNLTTTSLPNVKFSRVTDVTENPDKSRTVDVTVTCSTSGCNKTVNYTSTFTRW